jgi:hypothetical protein
MANIPTFRRPGGGEFGVDTGAVPGVSQLVRSGTSTGLDVYFFGDKPYPMIFIVNVLRSSVDGLDYEDLFFACIASRIQLPGG